MDSKARGIGYPWGSHRCGGRRDPVAVVTGHVIGVLLDIDELGLVCWVLFTLAIYALPVFVGVTAQIHQFKLEPDRSAPSSLASSRMAPRWCPGSAQFRSRAFPSSA